jgi:hypothetical protein
MVLHENIFGQELQFKLTNRFDIPIRSIKMYNLCTICVLFVYYLCTTLHYIALHCTTLQIVIFTI